MEIIAETPRVSYMDYIYKNGYWEKRVLLNNEYISVFFAGSEKEMDFNLTFTTSFIDNINTFYEIAYDFAYESPYIDDIRLYGGIIPHSLVVANKKRFSFWFHFVKWENGYLGVIFENGCPKDVYCDH
jgi:hypothetical protein